MFGLNKRKGNVYTRIVMNGSVKELTPIIQERGDTDPAVYTDGFRSYDSLMNFGRNKHYRIHHGNNESAAGPNRINGIGNFRSIAYGRLSQFRDMHKQNFYLHLKCEFSFNHRHEYIYHLLLKSIREEPLEMP